MKKVWIVILCISLVFILGSCGSAKQDNTQMDIQEGPSKLVVYINGTANTGENGTLYPTRYTVGPRNVDGVIGASGGNIFQQALKEYEEKTGIIIEIHYLEDYGSDERYMLQELYEDGKVMPDLVLTSKHHEYDYYNLAKNGLLLDLTPYFENDDEICDDALYFQQVLEAGEVSGRKYIMPLTFNMNLLITSETYMKEIGIIPQKDVSFEDIIYWLRKSCEEMQDSQVKEAIYDATGVINGQYIMSILNAAAHISYFDEDLNSTVLSEEALMLIYNVMGEYIEQEYTNVYGYENLSYSQVKSTGQSKKRYISHLLSGQEDYIGIFLSGGRGGGTNEYHSGLLDAAYFNSVYENIGDSMVMVGMPTYGDSTEYSANVDSMMFSFDGCQYPEAVYDLMRYLIDYPFIMEAGFSVNRGITEQQLNDAQNTTLTVCANDIAWSQTINGSLTLEQAKESMAEIAPLDVEYVEEIRYMLEHIGGASVSYYPLEFMMFQRGINEVGERKMTPQEAAEWTIARMEERLEMFEENIAFYDQDYYYEIMG